MPGTSGYQWNELRSVGLNGLWASSESDQSSNRGRVVECLEGAATKARQSCDNLYIHTWLFVTTFCPEQIWVWFPDNYFWPFKDPGTIRYQYLLTMPSETCGTTNNFALDPDTPGGPRWPQVGPRWAPGALGALGACQLPVLGSILQQWLDKLRPSWPVPIRTESIRKRQQWQQQQSRCNLDAICMLWSQRKP